MNLKNRISKLEREHGVKPGEPILPDVDEVIAQIQARERQQKAAEALLPPLEDVVADLQRKERERSPGAPPWQSFASPIAESGEKR